MKAKVQSIHFDADSKLISFIQGKIEKLNHFHDQIIDSEVFLRLDKSSTHENKIAEIRINIPGKTIFAKEQSKSFEEAADTAVDALRRQIVKHREKEIGE